MGYTTIFKGKLKFTNELTIGQLKTLNTILGKDVRSELPEDALKFFTKNDFYYVDLQITKDWDGVEWTGAEKSSNMEKQVAFVLSYMQSKYPDFGLSGFMDAQGEDIEDSWKLIIRDGNPFKVNTPPTGQRVTCPHCGEDFYVELKTK